MQGRRRKLSKTVRWGCYIPEDIALRIETLFFNQHTQKDVYGFRSQLVTDLLNKWIKEKEREMALSTTKEEAA